MATTKTRDGQNVSAGEARKTCPHCGEEKSLDDFGFRRMDPEDGEIRPQSWCSDCRANDS